MMAVRGGPIELDPQQLRAVFERALSNVLAGRGIKVCSPLDSQTFHALGCVCAAYPDVPEQLIAEARAVFSDQLNGAHELDGLPSFMRHDIG
ncbi:hypothetical protein [Nocardia tengchongensis]|uniref:hypothetical protein n=1 Tax=Nocardia tengchongensis TaxID=2055889 RepID=UPI0036795ED5